MQSTKYSPRRRSIPHTGAALVRLVALALLPALFAAGAFAGAAAAQANGTFYQLRESSGLRAQQRGDHKTAVRDLQIASFGQLEQPAKLARTLVHLAESLQALGDEERLLETILRLIELEERFAAYSDAELVPDQRRGFEQTVIDLEVPIAATAIERVFLERQRATAVAAAAPPSSANRGDGAPSEAARRGDPPQALQPETPEAEFERWLTAGKTKKARSAAQRWLSADGEAEEARCFLAATSRANAATCSQLLATLEGCSVESPAAALRARTRLACYQQLGQLEAAVAFLDELPEPLTTALSKQAQQVRRRHEKQTAAQAAAASRRLASAAAEEGSGEAAAVAAEPQDESQQPAQALIADHGAEEAAATPPAPSTSTSPRPETPARGTEPVTTAQSEPQELSVDTSNNERGPLDGSAAAPQPSDPVASLARRAAKVRTLEETEALLERAADLADELGTRDAEWLAGRLAYRASRWATAVDYLTRQGDPQSPSDLFYLSVALWEVGYRQAAAEALRASLPGLGESEYVQRRTRQILGDSP